MPRINKNIDNSDLETEGAAEVELSRLQQQYSNLEGDRRAYFKKSQFLIKRQQEEIQFLQQKYEEIITNIGLATSNKNIRMDKSNSLELKHKLQNKDEYDLLIEKERAIITKLDAEIKEMEDKINNQRKANGGLQDFLQHQRLLQKHVLVFENRLHQATVHFNTILAKNAELRRELEHLRIQKAVYDHFYYELSRELHLQKKTISSIIEQATLAYEQRFESQARMAAVRERSFKDLMQYNLELKELIRIIDHETKLKAFMQIKCLDRTDFIEEEKKKMKKGVPTEEKIAERTGEEIFQNYQDAYDDLVQLTGYDDMECLVDLFIENEQKNFADFSYVNELNNNVEELQEKIQNIKTEIQYFRSQRSSMEKERLGSLKVFEEKLHNTTQYADMHEYQHKEASKLLDQLKSGISFLFKKIKCDPTTLLEALGGSEGVTDGNVMQYLGTVEKSVTELLQIQNFLLLREAEEQQDNTIHPANLFLGGIDLQSSVSAVKVVAPTLGDYTDAQASDETVQELPLDHEELQKKVLQHLLYKEECSRTIQEKIEELHAADYKQLKKKSVF
ncbi:coiled-coil domain-containing protein 63 [Latimeria chalumnae]|uniref:Coiled-coil domain containing 63 n=1 Tax=Latimeria chalumnae TaxID=7897 RepID=H3B6E7_LATCH|nr:PREDICTED: coiled-coil domain-containing protein 63 [Latimeria chalumnae]|eukprot:XP_014344096.1 PREDICTED: coiled-coil domain-containing protein 63 [Latimeria chalumnae]